MFIELTEENTLKIRKELNDMVKSMPNHKYGGFFKSNTYIADYINAWIPKIIENHSFSTKMYWFMNNIREFPICSLEGCGKPITRNVINSILGYTARKDNKNEIFCSSLCAKHSAHYIQEQKQRIIEKYGKIKERQTYPEWFKLKNKTRYTRRISTYNNVMQSTEVRPFISLEEFVNIDSIKTTKFKWKCLKCGNIFESKYDTGKFCSKHNIKARCPHCYPPLLTSLSEKKLYRILCNMKLENIKFINCDFMNWKILDRHKQLDILAINEETNEIILAIEFNGSLWHSLEHGKSIEYHLLKTIECENKGIPLIHIWEDEWKSENYKNILTHVKSILLNTINFDSMLKDGKLVLDRSKYPKNIIPKNYTLIKEIPPRIIKRYNVMESSIFNVPDCGVLIYEKI